MLRSTVYISRLLLLATTFIAAAMFFAGHARAQPARPEPMKCETGPLQKTFGKSNWLVYSCSDQLSIVLISAPGSPASPFYFMLQGHGGGHRLTGEGIGDKQATDMAFEEIKALSEADIRSLLEQTQHTPARRPE